MLPLEESLALTISFLNLIMDTINRSKTVMRKQTKIFPGKFLKSLEKPYVRNILIIATEVTIARVQHTPPLPSKYRFIGGRGRTDKLESQSKQILLTKVVRFLFAFTQNRYKEQLTKQFNRGLSGSVFRLKRMKISSYIPSFVVRCLPAGLKDGRD